MTVSLDGAVERAIAVSVSRLDELSDRAARMFDLLLVDTAEVNAVSACRSEIARKLEGYRESMGSFNIALFGRTGAGKSSLIEALTSGDGTSISPGENDHTTEIRPVTWGPCRLYDTPGISGWGRTRSREELEATAREAVEIADLVLLIFDTQNQQVAEFSRIAQWVLHYDKPVIGVLNVRNPRWRLPQRMPNGDARRRISDAVRQHMQHIGDGLASHGLHAVPLIAWHASRAVAGRCSTYRGPRADTVDKLRRIYSPELLEQWSNVFALEELVVAALEEDAAGLRLQGATNDLRATLDDLSLRLGDEVSEMDSTAGVLDGLVDGAVALIGAGSRNGAGGALWRRDLVCCDDGADLLERAEIRRGTPFGRAALRGALHDRLESLLEADLTPVHLTAREAVEDHVIRAFAEARDLDAAELSALMEDYATDAQVVVQRILSDLEAFSQQRLSLAARRAASSARNHEFRIQIAANAKAGRALDRSGVAVELGGVGGAAAVVLLSSNPMGWAIIGGSATALACSWLGRRLRRRGERARLDERVNALSAVRRNCDEYFLSLREAATRDLADLCEEVVAHVLRPGLEQLDALDERKLELTRADRLVGETTASLPERLDAMTILRRAREQVERRRHGDDPESSRLVWAGEDWIEDPTGLGAREAGARRAPRRVRERMQARFEAVRGRLIAGIPADVESRATAWFERLRSCEFSDVRQLEEHITSEIPDVLCVGVVGDYSTGKSSLIARLHRLGGRQIPNRLTVGARPETPRSELYDVGTFCLIDTPGVGADERPDRLVDSIAACGLILHLFTPTLQTSRKPLQLVDLLAPDEPLAVSNARLLVLGLSRVDELAVDPDQHPDAFVEAVDRKVGELHALLMRREFEFRPEETIVTAASPYGLAEAAAYERRNHWWVGVPALHQLLEDDLRGIPWGALQRTRAAVAALVELGEHLGGDIEAIELSRAELGRVLDVLQDAKLRLDREIIASSRSRLLRDVHDLVEGLCSEVLSAGDAAKLSERKKVLEEWPENPLVQQVVETWEDLLRRAVDSWEAEFERAAGLEHASDGFSGSHLQLGDVGDRRAPQGSKAAQIVSDALRYAGRSRDAWYEITKKTVNWNFKPWGATKGATRVAKAGKVLGALGLALNAVELVVDVRAEKKRDEQRSEILSIARKSVLESLDAYLYAADPDGAHEGPLAILDERSRELGTQIEMVKEMLAQLRSESEALRRKQAYLEDLVRAGTEVLA